MDENGAGIAFAAHCALGNRGLRSKSKKRGWKSMKKRSSGFLRLRQPTKIFYLVSIDLYQYLLVYFGFLSVNHVAVLPID